MSSSDVRDLTRRIRLVQRRLQRAQAGKEDIKDGLLRGQTRSMAVMVYVFSGRDPNIAAEFLAFKARSNDCDMEKLLTIVQGAYAEMPAPSIAELTTDECLATTSLRLLMAAARFVLEFHLWNWLKLANCERGVAPSRLQLARQALAFVSDLQCPPCVQARVRKPLEGSARSQRKWLQKFRLGWGARLGVLQNLPWMPLQEMQEKASGAE